MLKVTMGVTMYLDRMMFAALLAVNAAPAIAKTLFACEGKSKVFKEAPPLHFELSQDNAGKYSMKYNGADYNDEPVAVKEVRLDKMQEFLKCDVGNDECVNKVTGGDEATLSAANVVALAKVHGREKMMKGHTSSLSKLDPSKIDHAKTYTYNGKKFGQVGVFEYYDKKDKLLGRYIYAIDVMDCVNKAKPTQDVGKMLKDLEKGAPPVDDQAPAPGTK